MPEKLRAAGVLALRFAFLTRYSWMLALAMVALPPLALVAAPTLLENLFVLDQPIQMLHVSWIAMFCATSMITTLHITTLNAIDRFDDYRAACDSFHTAWRTSESQDKPWYLRGDTWCMLALGLGASLGMWYVVVAACVSRTVADPGPAWSEFASSHGGTRSIAWAAWQQALYGLGCTVGGLLAVYLVLVIRRGFFCSTPIDDEPYRYQPSETRTLPAGVTPAKQPITEFLALLAGPGYFRSVVYQRGDQLVQYIVLAPGHAGLVMTTSLFGGWYGWNYVNGIKHGIVLDESSPFAALFFGLLSLQLIVLLLPGISFFLDRHRIPILPTLLFTMALQYSIFDTDHFYDVNPNPSLAKPFRPFQPLPWEEVLAKREFWQNSEGNKTLIVVDASGGGIQASAWTTQVLTGLHEVYGEAFSRSIGLISSVSGGSVGTMFYLTHRADMSDDFDSPDGGSVLSAKSIEQIRVASRASGLEATCWGIAYPDTLRAVFPPLAIAGIDRGWSIEQSWRAHMEHAGTDYGDLRLSQLGHRLKGGTMPVPVFNATLVETGQRLLISPALAPTEQSRLPSSGIEFLRCFPDSHLCLSTAARLSATFPYVTPVARSRPTIASVENPQQYPIADLHVADGAYVDNEGAVTSVDWINRLVTYFNRPENLDSRPFDRILLIRIQAFPKKLSRTVQAANSFAGWRAALLGPFDAMMHVRSTSQTERGDLEINLLTRATVAELKSAKQRTDYEFQMALSHVDHLESIHESLRRLAAATPGGNSEIDRQFVATDDELRITKSILQSSQQRQKRTNELLVESVVFDFYLVDGVPPPMSWKLTASQQRQIDHAWAELVRGNHPEKPLDVVDRYFERVP